MRQFCSSACYRAWLVNPEYQRNRQGQRHARAVAREFFPLQEWQVVHHADANTENNDPQNLMVFGSHAEHLSYHHGNPSARPLWRGDGQTIEGVVHGAE